MSDLIKFKRGRKISLADAAKYLLSTYNGEARLRWLPLHGYTICANCGFPLDMHLWPRYRYLDQSCPASLRPYVWDGSLVYTVSGYRKSVADSFKPAKRSVTQAFIALLRINGVQITRQSPEAEAILKRWSMQ